MFKFRYFLAFLNAFILLRIFDSCSSILIFLRLYLLIIRSLSIAAMTSLALSLKLAFALSFCKTAIAYHYFKFYLKISFKSTLCSSLLGSRIRVKARTVNETTYTPQTQTKKATIRPGVVRG